MKIFSNVNSPSEATRSSAASEKTGSGDPTWERKEGISPQNGDGHTKVIAVNRLRE